MITATPVPVAAPPAGVVDLRVVRVDATTASVVRDQLSRAITASTGEVIVDVGGVDIVDAVGLRVLVNAHRLAARRNVRLRLRSASPRVARTLLTTRLARTTDEQLRRSPGQRPPRHLVHRFG